MAATNRRASSAVLIIGSMTPAAPKSRIRLVRAAASLACALPVRARTDLTLPSGRVWMSKSIAESPPAERSAYDLARHNHRRADHDYRCDLASLKPSAKQMGVDAMLALAAMASASQKGGRRGLR